MTVLGKRPHSLRQCLNALASRPRLLPPHDGLNRVKRLAALMKVLEFDVPIVTVGGTNGKGTTVGYLEALYGACGYRTASFTSPHLHAFNERIKLGGQPVADDDLVEAFSVINELEQDELRYFDYSLLAALWIFKHDLPDVIILEVGIGGAEDAVNALDASVCVITSIGLDHQKLLGQTREAIATQKAGIFRAHRPMICGDTEPPKALLKEAARLQMDCHLIGRDFNYQVLDTGWRFLSQNVSYTLAYNESVVLSNLACALEVARSLDKQLPLKPASIESMDAFSLSGRRQFIPAGQQGLSCGVLLDVAHNPQAVKALGVLLKKNHRNSRVHVVFSMHSDKDFQCSIKPLVGLVSSWFVAPLKSPQAASIDALQNSFKLLNIDTVHFYDTLGDACQQACQGLGKEDLLLCYGSFELIAQCSAHRDEFPSWTS